MKSLQFRSPHVRFTGLFALLLLAGGCGSEAEGGSSGAGGSNAGNGAGGTSSGDGGNGNGSGGSAPTSCTSSCSSPATGSCAAPEVRITEVELGVPVVHNESETNLMPLAIAAIPSGGSRIAFMSDDDQVHVAELDCDDQLVGSPFGLPAHDFQDIGADDSGGVLMLTRDARGGGTLNCGNPTNLCDGGPTPPIPCYDMLMVRFDCAGNPVWEEYLTTASDELPPYSTGPNGPTVHMIWWYQHHGRLATDGSNWAAYFCDAISISENGCINIHQGDRMQVVGPGGSLVDHPDAFAGGCSHSGFTRVAWDEEAGRFVMVCKTDNQNRVAQPDPYRTIRPAGDLGSLTVGDVIPAKGGGSWVTVSDLGVVHLLHFDDGEADQDVNVASSSTSHLVSYGADHMVVAWRSGDGMVARVYDAETGDAVGEEFSIGVPDNVYQSFKAFSDGSAAYVAPGTSNTSVRIARVLPCGG